MSTYIIWFSAAFALKSSNLTFNVFSSSKLFYLIFLYINSLFISSFNICPNFEAYGTFLLYWEENFYLKICDTLGFNEPIKEFNNIDIAISQSLIVIKFLKCILADAYAILINDSKWRTTIFKPEVFLLSPLNST